MLCFSISISNISSKNPPNASVITEKMFVVFGYHKLSGWLEQASGLAYIKSRGRVKGQLLFPCNARDEQTAVLDAVEEESHVGHAQAAVQHTKGESSPLFGEIGHQELGQHLKHKLSLIWTLIGTENGWIPHLGNKTVFWVGVVEGEFTLAWACSRADSQTKLDQSLQRVNHGKEITTCTQTQKQTRKQEIRI
jgi:hypothetical protein